MNRSNRGHVLLFKAALVVFMLALSADASPLDPLTSRLEGAAFLQGEFVQTDLWALTLEEEMSWGTLFLSPPNLFLLEYTDPQGKRMGFDGENLYTVDPLFMQVILYVDSEPSSFLGMLEHFSDTTLTCWADTVGDSVTVNLSGDLGEGISSMIVGYTMSDSLPWLFRTRDLNGNVTSYSVIGAEINSERPPDFFTMIIPEGFELIDSGEI